MNIADRFNHFVIGLLHTNAVGNAASVGFALALLLILVAVQRSMRTQLLLAAQIADALSMQQRRADMDLFRDIDVLEATLARLLANGLARNIQLSPGSLLCAVSPAPYLAVTDLAGARIFITQQPQLFRRLGIARRIQRTANITIGRASRRATMQTIWDSACMRYSLPQPALPCDVDWHALVTHNDSR